MINLIPTVHPIDEQMGIPGFAVYVEKEESRFVFKNPHPKKKFVSDCVVRAFTLAQFDEPTASDYNGTKKWLKGNEWKGWRYNHNLNVEYFMGIVSNSGLHRVHGRYEGKGRKASKEWISDMTVREFADIHRIGTYLVKSPRHIVCIKDGKYLDAWDSGDEYIECWSSYDW